MVIQVAVSSQGAFHGKSHELVAGGGGVEDMFFTLNSPLVAMQIPCMQQVQNGSRSRRDSQIAFPGCD